MGIYHRIREKLAIWDSNSKFKICIFSWKFWISRMKSWSNPVRWNFVDLKVVGRLTSVQLFIETCLEMWVIDFVSSQALKTQNTMHLEIDCRFAGALLDLRGRNDQEGGSGWILPPNHPVSILYGSKNQPMPHISLGLEFVRSAYDATIYNPAVIFWCWGSFLSVVPVR